MIGHILFLCFLATALGWVLPPEKPIPDGYRRQIGDTRDDRAPPQYTNILRQTRRQNKAILKNEIPDSEDKNSDLFSQEPLTNTDKVPTRSYIYKETENVDPVGRTVVRGDNYNRWIRKEDEQKPSKLRKQAESPDGGIKDAEVKDDQKIVKNDKPNGGTAENNGLPQPDSNNISGNYNSYQGKMYNSPQGSQNQDYSYQGQMYNSPQGSQNQNYNSYQGQIYNSPQGSQSQDYSYQGQIYNSPQGSQTQDYSSNQGQMYNSPQGSQNQNYNSFQGQMYNSPQGSHNQNYNSFQGQMYNSPQGSQNQNYNSNQGQMYNSPQGSQNQDYTAYPGVGQYYNPPQGSGPHGLGSAPEGPGYPPPDLGPNNNQGPPQGLGNAPFYPLPNFGQEYLIYPGQCYNTVGEQGQIYSTCPNQTPDNCYFTGQCLPTDNLEVRRKMLQLIKETKLGIDQKVMPISQVHLAYKTNSLYKIGYLVSSINRTHDSVADFFKYVEQNINTWDIMKVLQAYEQVKLADSFVTDVLYTLNQLATTISVLDVMRNGKRSVKEPEINRKGNFDSIGGYKMEIGYESPPKLDDDGWTYYED